MDLDPLFPELIAPAENRIPVSQSGLVHVKFSIWSRLIFLITSPRLPLHLSGAVLGVADCPLDSVLGGPERLAYRVLGRSDRVLHVLGDLSGPLAEAMLGEGGICCLGDGLLEKFRPTREVNDQ